MNYKNLLFIFILVILISSYLVISKDSSLDINKLLLINSTEIPIEVVNTPLTRAQGLSGRKSLQENSGMLFIFPEEGVYSFWMKDMNFPIDIIWIDENFLIVDITKSISPESFPESFSPKNPIKYVLEVNSEFSEKNNIKTGDFVVFN